MVLGVQELLKVKRQAGEMAALTEDLGSIPTTTWWLTTAHHSSSMGSDIFWTLWAPDTDIRAGKTYIKNKSTFLKK